MHAIVNATIYNQKEGAFVSHGDAVRHPGDRNGPGVIRVTPPRGAAPGSRMKFAQD
jgi:hypothetical protein